MQVEFGNADTGFTERHHHFSGAGTFIARQPVKQPIVARTYLTEICVEMLIGYDPTPTDQVLRHSRKHGFDERELPQDAHRTKV